MAKSALIYSKVSHMKKVPALVSMFDALRFSPGARLALEMALSASAISYGEHEVFFAEAAMVESESILEERKKLLEQLNRKPKLDVSYAKEEEDLYALVGNDALVNRGRYTAPGVITFSEEDEK